jgi:hypothetical protein
MPLDRTKLHQGFRTYLDNAEKASGKTYEDFDKLLAKSALDRKSTRLNSSHNSESRMPSSA